MDTGARVPPGRMGNAKDLASVSAPLLVRAIANLLIVISLFLLSQRMSTYGERFLLLMAGLRIASRATCSVTVGIRTRIASRLILTNAHSALK